MRPHRSVPVRPTAVLAAFLIAPLVASCTNKEEPKAAVTNGAAASTPSPTAKSSATTARPSGGGTVVPAKPDAVSIQDYAFTPSPLPLKAGATATWTNLESDPPVEHWVKSDPGQAVTFDSGKLAPNASYTFTFSAPGQYTYYCAIHDFMKGTVVVGS